jgi:hypothetical protein
MSYKSQLEARKRCWQIVGGVLISGPLFLDSEHLETPQIISSKIGSGPKSGPFDEFCLWRSFQPHIDGCTYLASIDDYSGWLIACFIYPDLSPGYAGSHYYCLSFTSLHIVPLDARRLCLVKACGDSSAGAPRFGTPLLVEIRTAVMLERNQALRSIPLCLVTLLSLSVYLRAWPLVSLRRR